MIRAPARWAIGVLLTVVLILGVAWVAADRVRRSLAPDPVTIADASLTGLREQARLTTLVANYVAVVTARQSRFGLSAERTLILPGSVRYEVDLGKLRQQDVRWTAASHQLDIVLPPIELSGPQVDLDHVRAYDNGGLLLRLTDARQVLDEAARRAGQAQLLAQARAPAPVGIAKDAARHAVERSFALPLRAAGLNAEVRVRFPDEPAFKAAEPEQVDHSRSLSDIFGS